MLEAERYKSVWNMFLQALNHDPTACLRAFQCEQHVNKRGMPRWMQNNGLSVRKAKTLLRECKKSSNKQMPPSDSMFLPLLVVTRKHQICYTEFVSLFPTAPK